MTVKPMRGMRHWEPCRRSYLNPPTKAKLTYYHQRKARLTLKSPEEKNGMKILRMINLPPNEPMYR